MTVCMDEIVDMESWDKFTLGICESPHIIKLDSGLIQGLQIGFGGLNGFCLFLSWIADEIDYRGLEPS